MGIDSTAERPALPGTMFIPKKLSRPPRSQDKELAMAQGPNGFREAFTFDDVLLQPGHSDVLPSEVDIRS